MARRRYVETEEDVLYDALCLNYWGAHENARMVIAELTEAVIKRQERERGLSVSETTKEASAGICVEDPRNSPCVRRVTGSGKDAAGSEAGASFDGDGVATDSDDDYLEPVKDIDWEDASGLDQYPWNGWMLKDD